MCRGASACLQWLSGGRVEPARLCQGRAPTSCSAASPADPLGQNFAIAALPVIIFFAALISILYYLGIMQLIVRWIGGALEKVTGIIEGRIALRGRQHLRRPERIAARDPALSRRPDPGAAVPRDDRRHGRRRRHHPRGLCLDGHQHRLSARRQLHVGAGRHPDGQDHDARRARSRGRAAAAATARADAQEVLESTRVRSRKNGPPTSSWPPPRARRPASSWRSRSARWCSPSSRWSRSPTACSAGSAAGSAIEGLTFQAILGYVFAPIMYLLERAVGRGADAPAACSARSWC